MGAKGTVIRCEICEFRFDTNAPEAIEPSEMNPFALLRKRARASPVMAIPFYIARDSLQPLLSRVLYDSGKRHHKSKVTESVAYISHVYREYFEYSTISQQELAEKEVLEIGPGDNAGVSLLLFAYGAARVTAVDRFTSGYAQQRQIPIYWALRDTLPSHCRERFDSAIASWQHPFTLAEGAVAFSDDLPLETLLSAHPEWRERFDLVLSRSVLEHTRNPLRAAISLRALCAPGARMVHEICLYNHKILPKHGPMGFLRPHEKIWSLMSRHTGLPNRARWSAWQRALTSAGFEVTACWINRTIEGRLKPPVPLNQWVLDGASRATILKQRPHLALPFRSCSPDDLAIMGVIVTATAC
jgi:SAM-dependent methyltransferase